MSLKLKGRRSRSAARTFLVACYTYLQLRRHTPAGRQQARLSTHACTAWPTRYVVPFLERPVQEHVSRATRWPPWTMPRFSKGVRTICATRDAQLGSPSPRLSSFLRSKHTQTHALNKDGGILQPGQNRASRMVISQPCRSQDRARVLLQITIAPFSHQSILSRTPDFVASVWVYRWSSAIFMGTITRSGTVLNDPQLATVAFHIFGACPCRLTEAGWLAGLAA